MDNKDARAKLHEAATELEAAAIMLTLRVVMAVLADLEDKELDWALTQGRTDTIGHFSHALRNQSNGYFTGQPGLLMAIRGEFHTYLHERELDEERRRISNYLERVINFDFGGRRGEKVWLDMDDDMNGSYRMELRFGGKAQAKEWVEHNVYGPFKSKDRGGIITVNDLLNLQRLGRIFYGHEHLPVDPRVED